MMEVEDAKRVVKRWREAGEACETGGQGQKGAEEDTCACARIGSRGSGDLKSDSERWQLHLQFFYSSRLRAKVLPKPLNPKPLKVESKSTATGTERW